MKRIISLVFAALLFVCAAFVFRTSEASADAFDVNSLINSVYEPYFILVDASNPTKSYRGLEREADKQVFPASTTKVLTCIIALEEGNLDDMVTVSAKAVDFGRGNSLMGLEEGDQYTLRDLLYGMMLPSGNDAAIAIAEHIAGSTEQFADKMNEKAKSLGMTHSHFVTVHGKQNDNHYTTVRDMALLTAYALNKSEKKEAFRKIVGTKEYTASSGSRPLSFVNSNRLLVNTPPTEDFPNPISCLYADAIGIKTGDTNAAGKCLIAAAERDGVTLIAVLYGGTLDDPEYNPGWTDARKDRFNARRFQDAALLFDAVYQDMVKTVSISELVNNGMPVEFEVQIANASEDDSQGGTLKARAELSLDTTLTLMQPNPDGKISDLKIEVNPTFTSMYAPIVEGDQIGSVTYSYNRKTIAEAPLISTRSVKEGTSVSEVVPIASDNANAPVTNLIGGENDSSLIDGVPVNDGSGTAPSSSAWFWIVLIVLIVLLIVCVVLFLLYLRAEKKRREAARRRAARRRAREASQYGERR
ncbi:MAG: D-alanyl-D-alanine carboxypeptidase [Clostridia bacterium]|nr:D-alanyl-D-alanine carboxypeptidase [Clostridia bacterium]